jgi:rhamnosyltransferase subunit B
MARILIGWEFGSGMGHLTQLVKVAEALALRGHSFVFALRSLDAVGSLRIPERLAPAKVEFRQGPDWDVDPANADPSAPRHSLADALSVYAFQQHPRLLSAAHAWQAIVREADPDLIIADFSPTLRLAAGDRCPFVVVGNGYAIPPAGRALPPVRSWEAKLPPASIEAEAEITRTVLAVRRALGLAPVAFLSDLFSGDSTFVCTIPEFDPYGAYRRKPIVDFFDAPVVESLRPLAERQANRAHLYMPGSHPALTVVLSALQETGIMASAYVPSPTSVMLRQFSGPRLRFFPQPPPLVNVLPRCRLLIHHGGMLSTFTGLATATPQLTLPRLAEHVTSTLGARKLGCVTGVGLAKQADRAWIVGMLRKLVGDLSQWERAEACARRLAARPRKDPLPAILAACDELLAA